MENEIIENVKKMDRSKFLEGEMKNFAHHNTPLPIGRGQTISEPNLVLKMTLLLNLNKDCKVLEIGTGSGFQTAILAKFAKEVYTIEIIKELSLKAQKRLKELKCKNINYFISDGSFGLSEHSPFDRIIVTAGAKEIPKELLSQLANNGIMVIPVGPADLQTLKVVKKDNKGKITIKSVELVRFVEFVGKYGWSKEIVNIK